MNTPNKILMEKARETLEGKWKLAVKVTIVYVVIEILLGAISKKAGLGSLLSFIVNAPLTLGMAIFWLSFSRNQNAHLDQIFEGFETWWRAIKVYLLVSIYKFLWFLLLIIPGIIASLAYSQVFFIITEDKTIGANAAIDKSKQMMMGNKWKLFCLECRFLGWVLLCILTLGIGFLWLGPYIRVTLAKFYDDIKGGSETPVTPEVVAVPVAE